MPPTDTFPLADRLVPGGLTAYLAAARDAGDSYETIAYRLRSEHDITVSAETARKWCNRSESEAVQS
jgi:intein-encoded DNA endonuclease-like protein